MPYAVYEAVKAASMSVFCNRLLPRPTTPPELKHHPSIQTQSPLAHSRQRISTHLRFAARLRSITRHDGGRLQIRFRC
jgi:hypothetical protein